MKKDQANKIIAKYMGYLETKKGKFAKAIYYNSSGEEINYVDQVVYSESLDSLIPVWKKLQTIPLQGDGCAVCDYTSGKNTIQEFAAIITAKEIMEIVND